MLLDGLVDLSHQAVGLVQSDDDLMVVGDVVLRQLAPPAVLEPLLADLVATNVEAPDSLAQRRPAAQLARAENPDAVRNGDRPGQTAAKHGGWDIIPGTQMGGSVSVRRISLPPGTR